MFEAPDRFACCRTKRQTHDHSTCRLAFVVRSGLEVRNSALMTQTSSDRLCFQQCGAVFVVIKTHPFCHSSKHVMKRCASSECRLAVCFSSSMFPVSRSASRSQKPFQPGLTIQDNVASKVCSLDWRRHCHRVQEDPDVLRAEIFVGASLSV